LIGILNYIIMETNLVDILKGYVTPDVISKASTMLNELCHKVMFQLKFIHNIVDWISL
jgi:hypothetical protein